MGTTEPVALPPETLEGWYALHQVFAVDRPAWQALSGLERDAIVRDISVLGGEVPRQQGGSAGGAGWSAGVRLIGSRADVLFMHFRQTLDDIGRAQGCVAQSAWMKVLRPAYSFLSVTEAGMYHLTAKLAREAAARNGAVGDDAYAADLATRLEHERKTAHVERRLFPQLPSDMPYVCFYPMSKRRESGQNWYTLTLDERSQLMHAHGLTGRRYAGKVLQIISGAIGFENWEWGVTLFAKDPLDFKKLVTEMRFDEASAKYAEFGEFFVGKLATLAELV